MKTLLVIIIVVAVFSIAPKATLKPTIDINNVQTDLITTFPHDQAIACAWFVEAVDTPF